MTPAAPPFDAPLAEYERQAQALWGALRSGSDDARWCFKWEHPRFRGQGVERVDTATLNLDDARLVVAHRHAFETWTDLAAYTNSIRDDSPARRFEQAADAVVAGDLAQLEDMLRDDPSLACARSSRRHHATLLHYIAANGVEGHRQRTPANAVDVAATLLRAGAEPDALADMYDSKCTTMSMLVSSSHPHEAGLQGALAETLLDHGAALEGPGSPWQSALMTALAFGYLDTARMLAERGARVDRLPAAAGLGRLDDARRLLPASDERERHAALALAAQHGHADVVTLLLDAGESPDRYNPDGHHAHSTPLHQAVWAGQDAVVRLLVGRGARLDLRDTIYSGTPLAWAEFGGRHEIATYLRERGAAG